MRQWLGEILKLKLVVWEAMVINHVAWEVIALNLVAWEATALNLVIWEAELELVLRRRPVKLKLVLR